MAQKAKRGRYKSRAEFLVDMDLIVHNCHFYCETRFPALLPEADKLVLECRDLLEAETPEWWEEREEFRTPSLSANCSKEPPVASSPVPGTPKVGVGSRPALSSKSEDPEETPEEEDSRGGRVSLNGGKLVLRLPTARVAPSAMEEDEEDEEDGEATPPHPGYSPESLTESDPEPDFDPSPLPPPRQPSQKRSTKPPKSKKTSPPQQEQSSQERKTLVVVKKAGFKIRFTANKGKD